MTTTRTEVDANSDGDVGRETEVVDMLVVSFHVRTGVANVRLRGEVKAYLS